MYFYNLIKQVTAVAVAVATTITTTKANLLQEYFSQARLGTEYD
jgi:hypothetical protein